MRPPEEQFQIVDQIHKLQNLVADTRGRKKRIGFVPTMGSLHAGHRTLIRHARKENDLVVVSVFVNPIQFGPQEDLATYPRDLDGDAAKVREAGGNILFAPSAKDFYRRDFSTFVVPAGMAEKWEGERRPGHFRGVATVCLKLFNIVKPHYAYFGQKDAQQVAVIRKMVSDLLLPLSIIDCPTVRDEDGLALSSRNAYLSEGERKTALSLVRSLRAAEELFQGGERDAATLDGAAREILQGTSGLDLEYLALVDPTTFVECEGEIDRGRLVIAARVGKTRLIDNHELGQLFWRGNLLP